MTAPYAAQAESMIRQSLEHRHQFLVQPQTGEPFPLAVEDLEVTFSEDWAPHVQVTATAAMPEPDQLDALDARAGVRLLVSAGYVYPDRTPDVHQLADVALDAREVTRPDNRLKLTGVSAEAMLQDYRAMWTSYVPAIGINEAMDWLLAYGCQPYKTKVKTTLPAKYGAAHLAGIEAPIGTEYWTAAADAAQRVGAWIYCDGANVWNITQKPTLAGTPAHRLTVGQDGTVIAAATTLDRTAWANAVILTYDWTAADGTRRTIHGRAQASSGPFRPGLVGFRTHAETRELPVTQAQADRAAEGLLRNLISRGRGMTLEAIAAYWLRPGMTVAVTLPTGETESHLVMSVSFQPGTGTMRLTTRQPLDVTITTGE